MQRNQLNIQAEDEAEDKIEAEAEAEAEAEFLHAMLPQAPVGTTTSTVSPTFSASWK